MQAKSRRKMMTDRFDFEQKLIKMFDVVDDIKLVNSYIGDKRIDALAEVWAMKVEDMWSAFEEYVKDEHKAKSKK